MAKKQTARITETDVAIAVIAHEAVRCFCGQEQKKSAQPKRLTSCTGGTFWGKRGESWPVAADGTPLLPWLQVVCSEVKGAYGAFHTCQAIGFYIRKDFSDYEAASTTDRGDFVVREYGRDDKLVPLVRPASLKGCDFRRVAWEKLLDYPSLSKYHDLFDHEVYDTLCKTKNFRYDNRAGIKIGGWPSPIQRPQDYPGSCDLQIDMTENFMYGDSGIGYLSRIQSGWHVMFECC